MTALSSANSWGQDRIDQRALPLSGTYAPNPGVDGGGVHVYVIDMGLATATRSSRGGLETALTSWTVTTTHRNAVTLRTGHTSRERSGRLCLESSTAEHCARRPRAGLRG